VLNAACCLYMAGGSVTMRECVRLAQELLDSGRALAKLRDFIRLSREVAA